MRRAICILCFLLQPAVGGASLQLDVDRRYLIDERGAPFLMVGDAAWSLLVQLELPLAEAYLNDRATRGFNLVLVNLIEHNFGSHAPANAYGEAPFSGTPFISPSEAYFDHVDKVLELAAERDIAVLLAPVYLGTQCGVQGWCAEVESASLDDMRAWGRFLGQRYANFDDLIWLIGGDHDPTLLADKLREVVSGIREFDSNHLMTAHNQSESQAIAPWPAEDWLDINSVYTYSTTLYTAMREARDDFPGMPLFLLESAYENERGSTPASLRAQSHWAMLSGGFGHIFGSCPIWHFGSSSQWCGSTDWQAQLGERGSQQMTAFRNLYQSRHWHRLVPDFDQTLVVSGAGDWGTEDYAMAAWADDGSSILAYLPAPRAITIDSSLLRGSFVRAWWYDAYLGTAELAGVFPQGLLTFPAHPPDDWVLVLDDAGLDLPPPGQLPTAVAPEFAELRLESNRPNPFNPSTTLRMELGRDAHVTITIHDSAGRQVRVLLDGDLEAGAHELSWDGADAQGKLLPSGAYFCRVKTPAAMQSRKLLLLK